MKILSIFLMIIFTVSFSFADRVCILKSNGRPLEYQSGDAPLGTLTQNCINAGFGTPDMFEEKYVTKEEYQQIKEAYDAKPESPEFKKKEILKKKEADKKTAKDKLKTLGLSEQDLKALFE